MSEQVWRSLVDGFAEAPLDGARWLPALHALASATGSSHGQLIGIGARNATRFNLVTDAPAGAFEAYEAIGGADPRVNARVAAAMRARTLETVHEAHYDAVRPALVSTIYDDFNRKYDQPFGCQVTLINGSGLLIGLSILRSLRDGRTSEGQRALFASIAPHVRAAAKMQMAIEHQGASLLAGTLEAMSAAAFLLDRDGRVTALTPAAETLAAAGLCLRVTAGFLRGASDPDDRKLLQAIALAAQPVAPGAPPAQSSLIMRASRGAGAPLGVDIMPLARADQTFGMGAQVLVAARTRPPIATAVMVAAFGLTRAEAEIARDLSCGHSREAIAESRRVSVGTVRIQIKTIFQKLDVRREAELVARLNALR